MRNWDTKVTMVSEGLSGRPHGAIKFFFKTRQNQFILPRRRTVGRADWRIPKLRAVFGALSDIIGGNRNFPQADFKTTSTISRVGRCTPN
jgi:hypothetical protein